MNQKIDNQLRLALETPENVRARTEDLNVGFEENERSWEVIVRYHGSLEEVQRLGVAVEELLAGYAILTIPEDLVERVAELEEIEYMEKPKRFYYSQTGENILPREGSCIYPVILQEPYLTGKGVLAAVLDSGLDYRKKEFLTPDGSSRVLFLWDQTYRPNQSTDFENNPPEGFKQGGEFTREQINRVISEGTGEGMWITQKLSTYPGRDVTGHGTAVTGILAASDMTVVSGGELTVGMAENVVQNALNDIAGYVGIAPECEFLIVKLGIPEEKSYPRTTEIMRGITYVIRKALALQRPVVINLSIGNTYGPHDGSSLLESFINDASRIGRTVICVGSGNEADSAGHVFGNVGDRQIVEWSVGEYERNLSLQLWKNYSDEYRITLRSPGGENVVLSRQIEGGKYEVILEQTKILIYIGEPTPYSADQEIYMEFLPLEQSAGEGSSPYINSGIWQIQMEGLRIVTGEYSLYLPSRDARSSRTAFFRPTPEATFTIPSASSNVITVGAYDSTYNAYADFSGRGYEEAEVITRFAAGYGKPDLAAPGVNVLAPSIYGGYEAFTGTSFATPIVAGAAVLLMEWGIVRGNDPFLYGEKMKAYLIHGARRLSGIDRYPNALVGWGALCVKDSLP